MTETIQTAIETSKAAQDLTIVGVLFFMLFAMFVCLVWMARDYMKGHKETKEQCKQCEEKTKDLEIRCRDLMGAIIDLTACEDIEELRRRSKDISARLNLPIR